MKKTLSMGLVLLWALSAAWAVNPTKYTCGPTANYDFNLLNEWFYVASNCVPTAMQWLGCGQGGDLGELRMGCDGVATLPTAGAYFRIYALEGHRHNGRNDAPGGAYLVSDGGNGGAGMKPYLPFTRIEYMRVDQDVTASATRQGIAIFAHGVLPFAANKGTQQVRLTGCLIRHVGVDAGGSKVSLTIMGADTNVLVATVENCILYGAGVDQGVRLESENNGSVNYTARHVLQNVSIYNYATPVNFVTDKNSTGEPLLKTGVTNVVAIGATASCFVWNIEGGGGSFSNFQHYCASSDSSADDWGTGNWVTQVASECWAEPGTNMMPKAGGPLGDRGAPIASLTTDALRWKRPWGGGTDIGAVEYVPSGTIDGEVGKVPNELGEIHGPKPR